MIRKRNNNFQKKYILLIFLSGIFATIISCDRSKHGDVGKSNKNQNGMSEWNDLIKKWNIKNRKDDPDSLIVGNPIGNFNFSLVEKDLGLILPDELRSLYRNCNGFGFREKGRVYWFVPPINSLKDMLDDFKSKVSKMHPDLASSYLPVIDWGNGDYTGYLYDGNENAKSRLYTFYHEYYDYDSDQYYGEFMLMGHDSLQDLLNDE